MQLQSYLFLDGRCEEAVEFYKGVVGAQVTSMMRWKEMPDPQPGMLEPGNENKIMHLSMKIGGTEVLASDGRCLGQPDFKGFSLTITADSDAEAERIFNALSAGGQVQMPMTKTFFTSRFGMLADKFGVPWMVLAKA